MKTIQVEHTYRIGEVAERTGLTVDALRYYERMGLLPRAPRTSGGLRRYDHHVLDRVRFIKQAQTLGLTLREIQQLAGDAHRRSRAACRRVHDVLARHLAEIDQRVAELQELRGTLSEYLKTCESALGHDTEPECPTLSALEEMKS
jgi:MerR family transcriptional regulator, copper efflux regulator